LIKKIQLKDSLIKAKIIGLILIIIGTLFLIEPTIINLKISFLLILLGIFTIIMITERSVPKKISDAQINGNMNTITRLISDMKLTGNAVFIPKSKDLSEERVFIPPNKTGTIKIPEITNEKIIIEDKKGKKIGISVPPSGLVLLQELENDKSLHNVRLENLEEKLQIFVGANLVKSITFRKQNFGWKLKIEKNEKNNNFRYENQYPDPTCSAILTMITRVLNRKVRIYNAIKQENIITFHLNFVKRKGD